jgi:hypothetical protein
MIMNFKFYILRQPADGYRFRKVRLVNGSPSDDATVTTIPFVGYIQDFSPQHQVFWTQRVIYKETPDGLSLLLQMDWQPCPEQLFRRESAAFRLVLLFDKSHP